jgi:hypothetical protein
MLVMIIMPASGLVLPLFLEMDLFHLLNTARSGSCRSASSPSGPTTTGSTRSRPACSTRLLLPGLRGRARTFTPQCGAVERHSKNGLCPKEAGHAVVQPAGGRGRRHPQGR